MTFNLLITSMSHNYREIPYNYTSADDRKIIEILFSESVWLKLEVLRTERKTGRSARLLMRIIGELFIYFRNPYLKKHLAASLKRKNHFFSQCDADLSIIRKYAKGNTDVLFIIDSVEEKIELLKKEIRAQYFQQTRILLALGSICGRENIVFDAFTLTGHTTDATDWRLYPPIAVIRPNEIAQVAKLLKAIGNLGYKVIVCGGATGLTGGTVPLTEGCIIINTEKLNKIFPINERSFTTDDGVKLAQTLKVESGAITEDVMKFAEKQGLIFATDPTSAWASTIGGNLAENAGGKRAVKWGTAIDNVLGFDMAMPDGTTLHIERANHQLRKILQHDVLVFEITNQREQSIKKITIPATEIRKPGLWKDITNKVLGGIPGLQKEGTDGVILQAEFILYPEFSFEKTFCLEFFGADFNEASRVIQEINASFSINDPAALIALEHFDQEYIKAVQYRVKSDVAVSPKAVLLIDMASHEEQALNEGAEKLKQIIAKSNTTEIHTAKNKDEAKLFWHDRKQLGAIARRTNAFKLNEDIVLPLHAIAQFTNWVDEINVREEKYIQQKFLHAFKEQLQFIQAQPEKSDIADKITALLQLVHASQQSLAKETEEEIRNRKSMKSCLRGLKEMLRGYETWLESFNLLYDQTMSNILIVATHMHAGDGNIHVNIPVFSNVLDMMHRAEMIVDEVMYKTTELGGVVSGEHGIGITKIKYLDEKIIQELNAYRQEVDPAGMMNPEKLQNRAILNKVFTPSFNLLELEARILKRGKLETLATKIAHCVRCGKCKGDCCVFHPKQNMFFHPRNKNLAIGMLIEAILFEAQRYRNTSFELLKELEEIADNCTICHKCKKPCPVKIDTGEITVLERYLLMDRGLKHSPLATKLTLKYLQSTSKLFNALVQTGVLNIGMRLQNIGYAVVKPLQSIKPLANTYLMQLLSAPMPPASAKTLRHYLPETDSDQVLVFEGSNSPDKTYFYFPGCGSERMFSDISLAALYVLLKNGARVILPPPFICCGFPVEVNGRTIQHNKLVLRNTIILSQIRDMFKHLSFDSVCVTCGTCKEGLETTGISGIFNAPVKDVLHVNTLPVSAAADVLYHKPCHDSLVDDGVKLLNNQLGCTATAVPHCCSEAGTLALSRPGISSKMRNKKTEAITEVLSGRQGVKMLTNCPSCMQGLGKQKNTGIIPQHLTVFLAEQLGGKKWKKELLKLLSTYERVTI